MGQNKDATIGFIGIGIIIVIIVGAVVVLLPVESETVQNETEKTISEKESETYAPTTILTEKEIISQVDIENAVIVTTNDIHQQVKNKSNESINEIDPNIIASAEKAFGTTNLSFQIVLEECESIESYDEYVVFKNVMELASDDMSDLMRAVDDATKLLESSGYDTNPMIEQLIAETRYAANDAGNCMAGLIDLYEN